MNPSDKRADDLLQKAQLLLHHGRREEALRTIGDAAEIVGQAMVDQLWTDAEKAKG